VNDLRHLRVGRHQDRPAQPVEHFLEPRLVGDIVCGVLQFGGRDGDDNRDVLLAAGCLGEAIEEIVEPVAVPFLPVGADIADDLVQEDQHWPVLRQHRSDRVPLRLDELPLMLPDDRERLGAADLPGDLAPRCFADRLIPAAPALKRVELFAHEDRDGRLGHPLNLSLAQDSIHAIPGLRLLAAIG
jgi:hypothetical protein